MEAGTNATGEGDVTCFECSHPNPQVSLYCRGCYRPLIGIDDEQPVEYLERFHVLAEACEKLRSGNWTRGEFQAWLQDFAEDQRSREEGIRSVIIPFGLEEDFEDEQEVGWSGVEACNRGLARLIDYRSDDNVLMEGLRLFWRGVCLVKEAMQINRANSSRAIWA